MPILSKGLPANERSHLPCQNQTCGQVSQLETGLRSDHRRSAELILLSVGLCRVNVFVDPQGHLYLTHFQSYVPQV